MLSPSLLAAWCLAAAAAPAPPTDEADADFIAPATETETAPPPAGAGDAAQTEAPGDAVEPGDAAGEGEPHRHQHRHRQRYSPTAPEAAAAPAAPTDSEDFEPGGVTLGGVTLQPGAPLAPPKTVGQLRFSTTLARLEVLAQSADWSGGALRLEGALAVERNMGDLLTFLPGIGLRLGVAVSGASGRLVSTALSELELGISYQFPHGGLWDLVFPYAHANFLAGWAHLEAGFDLQGDAFVPGFAGAVGLRVALPRFADSSVRLFGIAEVAGQVRASFAPRLRRPDPNPGYDPDVDPPPIREAGIPLGTIDLTGFTTRFGIGLEM